ncbi:MAG: putative ATP-grasp superfamily ATP-dependent carboligase/protein-tyrosine-phosphatase [Halioglobus sp.]|jgi:predicted ATP-grasp superfamily ATP-dependent carboligase/protein-tyrosine-phosphatase
MKGAKLPRVLVLDGDMVPSLTVSRSLSRRGCVVDIASHTEKPLAGFSRATNECYQYPDPLAETEAFLDWLFSHTQSNSYDLVIPVTERTLVPLSRSRERLQSVKLAMPSADSLEVALDKAQTMALADRMGVPRPGGLLIDSLDALGAAETSLRYPVVLKPARSIGAGEKGASQLQVGYAFNSQELRAGSAHALRFGPVLLQELFAGDGVGIELIARQGEIAYAFQHRRVHEVPLTGGGSSLRKSEAIDPQLLEASRKLIAELKWNGVAMVEFKQDAGTGEFSLMEINGRFWGSLPLADSAGADFPSMLLDLELNDEIVACDPYRNDIYCRLLSRDLHWYEAVLRRDADPRIATIPSAGEILREMSLLLSLKHRFDVQSFRDPLPGLIDVGRIIKGYYERLATLASERAFLRAQEGAWKRGEVASAIVDARSMLFICYGNINRSALADVMVKAYAEDSGIGVCSAGFHEEEKRGADPVMIDVAAGRGLDLSVSRSSCVSSQMLEASDVIFVMEKVHFDRLVAMDEGIAGKVYLLGAHPGRDGKSPEIADPYGLARNHYEDCCNRIAEAVDNIKAVIAVCNGD